MTERGLRTTLVVRTFSGLGKGSIRLLGQPPSPEKGTLWRVILRTA
jgi:hypothetical protein